MSVRYYEKLDEQLFKRELPNGLTVLTVPKPGFTKKLAYFVTDFGSIHTDFELDGEVYQVPAGVAHYLEHKLFDMPGGRDISAEFAAFGAGVNAFTSFDMTAYYFPARSILKTACGCCWNLSPRLILRRRRCKRSRGSSARRSI